MAFEDTGIKMRIAAADAGSSAVALDEKAFFADVRKDLDHMVVAQPMGVQTFQTVRSAAADEQYALSFSLPDGARLRVGSPPVPLNAPVTAMRPQFVEIVKGDKRLATVSLPVAWDAQDRPVKADYAIVDDQVRITVRHRDKDLAYPITVDPYVYEQQSFNQGSDFTGWVYGGNRPYYIAGLAGDSYFGRGLYLYNYANTFYSAGEYGQWTYTAPTVSGFESEGAFIYKVDFGDVAHTLYQAQACAVEGIYRLPAFRWESPAYARGPQTTDALSSSPSVDCGAENYNYDVHGINNPLPADGGPPPPAERAAAGNTAVFQYYVQYNGTRSSSQALFVGRTLLHMSDRGDPRVSSTAPPGWLRSGQINVSATDYGLGMRRVGVTGSSAAPTYAACGSANLRNAPCPRTLGTQVDIGSVADEGIVQLSAYGVDVVERRTNTPVTVRIDRNGPEISYTGEVAAARLAVPKGRFGLTVTARDGQPGGTPAQRRSGAKKVFQNDFRRRQQRMEQASMRKASWISG